MYTRCPANMTYLVLRKPGYPVSAGDGAWLEWGNDDHLPIATGPSLAAEVSHGQ